MEVFHEHSISCFGELFMKILYTESASKMFYFVLLLKWNKLPFHQGQ